MATLILNKENTTSKDTSKYDDNRTIFINNNEGDLVGFFNPSSHFLDSAYDELVEWMRDNKNKLDLVVKSNSKGSYIQVNVGTKVLGFFNSPKHWEELIESVQEGSYELNLAQEDIDKGSITEFLNNL